MNEPKIFNHVAFAPSDSGTFARHYNRILDGKTAKLLSRQCPTAFKGTPVLLLCEKTNRRLLARCQANDGKYAYLGLAEPSEDELQAIRALDNSGALFGAVPDFIKWFRQVLLDQWSDIEKAMD